MKHVQDGGNGIENVTNSKVGIGAALDALMLNSTTALLRHKNDNLQYEIFLLTYTDRQITDRQASRQL